MVAGCLILTMPGRHTVMLAECSDRSNYNEFPVEVFSTTVITHIDIEYRCHRATSLPTVLPGSLFSVLDACV